jgi:hypothetical protein
MWLNQIGIWHRVLLGRSNSNIYYSISTDTAQYVPPVFPSEASGMVHGSVLQFAM